MRVLTDACWLVVQEVSVRAVGHHGGALPSPTHAPLSRSTVRSAP